MADCQAPDQAVWDELQEKRRGNVGKEKKKKRVFFWGGFIVIRCFPNEDGSVMLGRENGHCSLLLSSLFLIYLSN